MNLPPIIHKPDKTAADYIAIAFCPALIMTLVGSLVLFLLETSYSGPWLGNMRWVLCWFTLAIVLVARIAIEQTRNLALVYGAFLALATSAFIGTRFGFVLPVWLLLGVIWWASDRITWDCTLIDEDVDSSGAGLLQADSAPSLGRSKSGLVKAVGSPGRPTPTAPAITKTPARRRPVKRPAKKRSLHSPGLWVLYFSMAAIPLFGGGEILLPAAEPAARRLGFRLLLVYLASGAGLLLLTSFLGLRRYLRQRFVPMPASIAFVWVRTGTMIITSLLVVSVLLPRPVTPYSLDRLVTEPDAGESGRGKAREAPPEKKDSTQEFDGQPRQKPEPDHNAKTQDRPGEAPTGPNAEALKLPSWSGGLSWLVALAVAGYFLVRFWPEFMVAWRAFVESFRRKPGPKPGRGLFRRTGQTEPPARLKYENPFQTGQATRMEPAELIRYSYEAVRAWAALRGTRSEEHETPVEFAERLVKREPALTREILLLSRYYSHLAYAGTAPPPESEATLQKLWSFMTFSPTVKGEGDHWG